MATCSIDGCRSNPLARGWCTSHYERWRRHGDPLAGGIFRPKVSVEERFWSKVDKSGECWNWSGTLSDQGYGKFVVQKKQLKAHRLAWGLLIGELSKGDQLDHRCRNRRCVNPSHLRIVTNKQNGEHKGQQARNKSGYRGVFFDKQRSKWRVSVGHHGKYYYGGFFTDVHEAGKAAKALRNKLYTHNDLDRITS